jgi:uncharacterized protein YqgV (UPF0045/DUF77 family)
MAVAEISIVPIGTKTTSVSKHVVIALKALRKEKKVMYELTSMGTISRGNSTMSSKRLRRCTRRFWKVALGEW